jgi:hypothetical protein
LVMCLVTMEIQVVIINHNHQLNQRSFSYLQSQIQ